MHVTQIVVRVCACPCVKLWLPPTLLPTRTQRRLKVTPCAAAAVCVYLAEAWGFTACLPARFAKFAFIMVAAIAAAVCGCYKRRDKKRASKKVELHLTSSWTRVSVCEMCRPLVLLQ